MILDIQPVGSQALLGNGTTVCGVRRIGCFATKKTVTSSNAASNGIRSLITLGDE